MDYPEKGDIIISFQSMTHPKAPPIKGNVRGDTHIAGYIIKPSKMGNGKGSELHLITQVDVKVWTSFIYRETHSLLLLGCDSEGRCELRRGPCSSWMAYEAEESLPYFQQIIKHRQFFSCLNSFKIPGNCILNLIWYLALSSLYILIKIDGFHFTRLCITRASLFNALSISLRDDY